MFDETFVLLNIFYAHKYPTLGSGTLKLWYSKIFLLFKTLIKLAPCASN